MDTQFLLKEILGNTLQDYSWFFGAILLGIIFKKLISKYLSRLLFKIIGKKGAEVGVEKFDELLTKPIGLCVMLSIIYLGSSHIQYPPEWNLGSENEMGYRKCIWSGCRYRNFLYQHLFHVHIVSPTSSNTHMHALPMPLAILHTAQSR